MSEYNLNWKPPIAKPKLWHKKSIADWNKFGEESEKGRAERRAIIARYKNRSRK